MRDCWRIMRGVDQAFPDFVMVIDPPLALYCLEIITHRETALRLKSELFLDRNPDQNPGDAATPHLATFLSKFKNDSRPG